MSDLKFSIWRLLVENIGRGLDKEFPAKELFNSCNDIIIVEDGKLFTITIEKNSDYCYFSVDYGSRNPRDEKVVDFNTKEIRENPRSEDEVEQTKQFFALYDFRSNLFYLSGVKNKNKIVKLLNRLTSRKFNIEGIYQKKDFLKSIESVKKVKFSSIKDLFSMDSKRRKAFEDLTGLSSSPDFELNINFKEPVFNSINFVKKLIKGREQYDINDLIIYGNDSDGLELVYNEDTFIKKITIIVDTLDTGKFDSELVKISLLQEIQLRKE